MPRNKTVEHQNPRQNYGTPWYVFNEINKACGHNIVLDVCANEDNAKCPSFIDEEANGLIMPWIVPDGKFWFCNPPFNQAEAFIAKAWREYNKGYKGFMLLPSNQETVWFRDYITHTSLRRMIWPERISFIDPETGKPKPGNTIASVVVAFCEMELPDISGEPWIQSLL